MLSAPAHPTYAALLAACALDPDEDTPRLALADWLEENDDPVRGEFIRVQVELARRFQKVPHPQSDEMPEWGGLVFRESALLREHEARWRRGPECERCGGKGWRRKSDTHRGRDCPACHGTGWERWWLSERLPLTDLTPTTIAYGPQGRDFVHPVTWERGFIVQVDCNLDDVFHADAPTPWALAVVRSEPLLRRFGVVDRPAYEYQPGVWYLGGNRAISRPDLPEFLWNEVWKRYPESIKSEAAANRALAEACWKLVSDCAQKSDV